MKTKQCRKRRTRLCTKGAGRNSRYDRLMLHPQELRQLAPLRSGGLPTSAFVPTRLPGPSMPSSGSGAGRRI